MHKYKIEQLMAIQKPPVHYTILGKNMDETANTTISDAIQQSRDEFAIIMEQIKDEHITRMEQIKDEHAIIMKQIKDETAATTIDTTVSDTMESTVDDTDMESTVDDTSMEPTVEDTTMESTVESTVDKTLLPWRQLYDIPRYLIQVHHYDYMNELDNWIRGDAWVQGYDGWDDYYITNIWSGSKEEMEIEQFEDNFYQWQVDELAKPGSP